MNGAGHKTTSIAVWPMAIVGIVMLTGAVAGLIVTDAGTARLSPSPVSVVGLDEFVLIFSHNSSIGARLLLGAITFGVHACVQVAWIGFDLASLLRSAQGVVPGTVLAASVVPHAIFELPAFVLLGSAQLELLRLARRVFADQGSTLPYLARHLAFRSILGFLLLFVAAVVEATISGRAGEFMS